MSARLDAALAQAGLARSRTHAARLIESGLVAVDGATVNKPSAKVTDAAQLSVAEADHYVSRAAHKLIAALDGFGVPASGRIALDMGASTGGFTQVLRERGAEPVIAVDVGHGQLSPTIATDPGVIAVEGYNVRFMTPDNLAEVSGIRSLPGLITGDLSFISLELVIPAVALVASPETDIIVLIKPQFEVGRTSVREGLVTSPTLRADAVASVLWSAWDAGLGTYGVLASPITGTHGNSEYLAHLRVRGRAAGEADGNPTQWLGTVNQLAGAS